MKKPLIVISLVILAVLAFGVVGLVYAQPPFPPTQPSPGFGPGMMGRSGMMGGRGMMGGQGMGGMHPYMLAAVAEKLGMTPEELQDEMNNGKTMWQVAEAKDLSNEEITLLMLDARTKALDDAVAAGAMTADQAEWMRTHWEQMEANGMVPGGCHNQGGVGMGGMMRSRWNNSQNQ